MLSFNYVVTTTVLAMWLTEEKKKPCSISGRPMEICELKTSKRVSGCQVNLRCAC